MLLSDAIGPAQTIVLEINSGGGYVAEWEMIRDSIYDAPQAVDCGLCRMGRYQRC
jgi:ATP-dependent protease ClpP protease subunit